MTDRGSLAVVAVATVAFALALASREAVNVWLASAAAAAIALLAAWRPAGRVLGLLRPRVATVLLGTAAGLALLGVTHLGFALIGSAFPAVGALVAELYRVVDQPPGAAAATPVIVLVVLAEEVVWRGHAVRALAGRPAGTVLVVATLLYVVPQLASGNPALLAAGLGCGLVWTALRLATGELVAPFLCHLVWDLGVFVVWPLATR